MEDLVDARASGLQVTRNRGNVPPLKIEVDHGEAALRPVRHLGVGRVASLGHGWQRLLSQNPLDGLVADPAVVPPTADRRDLVWPE
jgi:hypothetical protein